MEKSKSVREGRGLRYGEVSDDGSERRGCREPDKALSFATRANNSSVSGNLGRVRDLVMYSEKTFLAAVIELTSPSTWQDDFSKL